MGSFSGRPTYHVWFSIDIRANTLWTVTGLLDKGASPNHINRSLWRLLCPDYNKLAESPNLRTATEQAVHVDSIIPMFLRIGDLRSRFWFEFVENLAFDVLLGTSFIDHFS